MPPLKISEATKVGTAENITGAPLVNKLLDELLVSARAENAATAQQEREKEPLDQLLARLGLDRTAAAKRDADELKKVIFLFYYSTTMPASSQTSHLVSLYLLVFLCHRPSSCAARPPSRRLPPL
jgi:hypothetical protein